MVSYGDAGIVQDPSDADHIMWGQVDAPNGFRVMAYDVPAGTPWSPGENAYFVSLRGDAAEEVSALWTPLSDGATILRSLEQGKRPANPS
jgi:PhnB protein